jgi:hypothetical protein
MEGDGMAKLSKRQRDEKTSMRRQLILGGGAAGLLALAGGIVISRPPTFPQLDGTDTIGQRLAAAGLDTHHQQLAGDPATIDILAIGDTSCGFCQRFVADGLDDLIVFARTHDLSFGYASIGFTPAGAATTAVAACMERIPSALSPPGRVRAIYELGGLLAGDGRSVGEVISGAAADLGVRSRQIDACMARETGNLAARNHAMKSLFQVTGTPTFVVRKRGGGLATFNGFSGSASVIRQVEAALAS